MLGWKLILGQGQCASLGLNGCRERCKGLSREVYLLLVLFQSGLHLIAITTLGNGEQNLMGSQRQFLVKPIHMSGIETDRDGAILIEQGFAAPFAQAVFRIEPQILYYVTNQGIRHDDFFLTFNTKRG